MSAKEYLDKWYEAKRWEFYAHVRPWIAIGAEMAKASGWRMSRTEYCDLIRLLGGMNSYERRALLPVLDDLAAPELVSQYRTFGELEVVVDYDEALQRELAPLLVEQLQKSLETIAHLKETASGQQKRADKAEAEHLLVQKDLFKAWEERDTARKQAATWEIQAQDLRDQLIQVKSELAAVKAAEPACTKCGQPVDTTLCWECAR